MNTRQYEYVLAVFNGKTLRQAAQDLFVSEPTISQQIKALETELGISLFEHTGKALWPTEACKALLPDFQRMIEARATIHESVCRLKQPTLKAATFTPTDGYLLCPHCGEKITASNGRGWHIREQEQGAKWEKLSSEKWQCMRCHKRYALPSNPFKSE